MKKIIGFTAMLAVSSFSHAALYSEIVSFGDSWSDTGNFNAATGIPRAPLFDGNFSNGFTWTEYLGQALSIPSATESALGGHNYAWGGATALESNTLTTPLPFDIPSLEDQLQEYLTDVSGVANASALFTIWGGVNDKQSGFNATNAAATATKIASLAQDLLTAGAQNILVLNMPFSNDTYDEPFNNTLSSLLAGISGNIMQLDMQALYNDVELNLATYGISSFTENCGAITTSATDGGTISANCGSLFFVDPLGHHSAKGNQIIAQAAYATVVPIPAASWFFITGIMTLMGLRRTHGIRSK